MACLWSDGFDPYGTPTEGQTRYASASIAGLYAGSTTAFGSGQTIGLTNTPTGLQATYETHSNEVTVYGSVRVIYPTSSNGSILSLSLQDAGTDQVTLQWLDNTTMQVRSGGISGTILGSISSAFTLNVWDSWQFKVVINNTNGSVEVRKNGSNVASLNLTNVNTRGGTANNYSNGFRVGSSLSQWLLDDFYLNSDNGTAPTSWPGDVRIIYVPVASAVQQQLYTNQSVVTVTPFGSSSTTPTPAGTARYTSFVPTFTGTVGTATIVMGASGTGHMKAAIYTNTLGTPVATSTEVTNPPSGNVNFTFASPPTVSKGQTYYLAVDQDFTANYTITAGGPGRGTSTTAYASFPVASPALTQTSGLYCTLAIATTDNGNFVSDLIGDSDGTTVYSAVASQGDIYTVAGLGAANPASIIGVRVMAEWRKSDAGPRGGSLGVNANGSGDVVQVNNVSPSVNYTYATKYMPTDPTGAAWTVANVNNMQISLKVSS